jgi:beta-glucanase (GH16 family)
MHALKTPVSFQPFSQKMIQFLLAAVALAQQERTGNCLSGRYQFDKNRAIFVNYAGEFLGKQVDESRYDFTIDYGVDNAVFENGGVELSLSRNPSGLANGIRLSTTRYIQYANITAQMSAIGQPGVVTSFITMAENHDEIDFETVGKDRTTIQTNVFARGILERGQHGATHRVGDITRPQQYNIDWNSERIVFGINGAAVRTHRRNGPEANRPIDRQRGHPWYPITPSLVQFAVWESDSEWAGAPLRWPANESKLSVKVDWIDIQCYNDKNQIVPKWPVAGNPDRQDAFPDQPIVNGTDRSFLRNSGATRTPATTVAAISSGPTNRAGSTAQGPAVTNPATTDRTSDAISHTVSFLSFFYLLLQ